MFIITGVATRGAQQLRHLQTPTLTHRDPKCEGERQKEYELCPGPRLDSGLTGQCRGEGGRGGGMWSDSFHLDQAPGHTDLHPPAALVLAQGEIVLLNYD